MVFPLAGDIPAPSAVGPHFDIQGEGRYYNPRNLNGHQFNTGTVKGAVMKGVENYSRAQYFRRAGMGAALRYTLGMPQLPSHVNDYLNARTHGQRQTGLNPGRVQATTAPATEQEEQDVASGRYRQAGQQNRSFYRRVMGTPTRRPTDNPFSMSHNPLDTSDMQGWTA